MIAVIIQHPVDNPRPVSVLQSWFVGSFWTAGREGLKQERTKQGKRRSLQTMTPDELLNANSRDLAIRYSEIASVEVRRRFFQWQLRFHLLGPSETGRIIQFNLSGKQIPEAQRLLKRASLSEND